MNLLLGTTKSSLKSFNVKSVFIIIDKFYNNIINIINRKTIKEVITFVDLDLQSVNFCVN